MITHKKAAQFMRIALEIARLSKDRSTQVGALALTADGSPLTWGYNGFPRGCADDVDARHERPEKYVWTEHAERNLIFNAARNGISLHGGTIIVTKFPCVECARAIVQAGFCSVVAPAPENNSRWLDSNKYALVLFHEVNVEVVYAVESHHV